MDERIRADQILKTLAKNFQLPQWTQAKREPFQTLIRTVLSQATNDRNRDRAYQNLSKKYDINPETLARASVREIEEAIRVGGLYRNKSRKIKELSKVIIESFGGSLDFIRSEPLEKARSMLMTIPGVGPKTADVVSLFSAGKPTVPVDTHVNRVSRRLGLAPLKGDYEEIRKSLEALYQPSDYFAIHLLLISLGREYCRARRPLHKSCPVSMLCPIPKRETKNPELHRLHRARDYP
jgi:endonuclease-3